MSVLLAGAALASLVNTPEARKQIRLQDGIRAVLAHSDDPGDWCRTNRVTAILLGDALGFELPKPQR